MGCEACEGRFGATHVACSNDFRNRLACKGSCVGPPLPSLPWLCLPKRQRRRMGNLHTRWGLSSNLPVIVWCAFLFSFSLSMVKLDIFVVLLFPFPCSPSCLPRPHTFIPTATSRRCVTCSSLDPSLCCLGLFHSPRRLRRPGNGRPCSGVCTRVPSHLCFPLTMLGGPAPCDDVKAAQGSCSTFLISFVLPDVLGVPLPSPFLLSTRSWSRPLTHLLPALFDTLIPIAPFVAGQTSVVTSTWSFGITGTFLVAMFCHDGFVVRTHSSRSCAGGLTFSSFCRYERPVSLLITF
jgi:hypothetical protein